MADYFVIKSKMNGNVIDILGASPAEAAPLDAYPRNSPDTNNQLWEFVADPGGSGYFFIKSKMNGYVVDISGASMSSGATLDAFPQKPAGKTQQNDNQLWLFLQDPKNANDCFIVSRLNGNVIDIKGANTAPAATLDAFPLKPSGFNNQLWSVVGGSFPSPLKAVPAPGAGLKSNSNYKMYNNCKPLVGATAIIDVTQDIVAQSASGSQIGFSFQMNCYSPLKHQVAYQQFVLGLLGSDLQYNIQGGKKGGAPLFNVGYAELTGLSTSYIPAGYQLVIGFATQSTLVSKAFFIVRDQSGNTLADQTVVMSSIDGVPSPSVGSAPVVCFELNLVGPENGENAVLSSGAGTITYVSEEKNLTPLSQLPPCADTTGSTTETANSVYGILPPQPNGVFKQSFNVTGG
ncbi:MAG TPA: RICIN domain-containing protein [Stellaceae bacterium]|nr:RICIN domain-containing protein [Stellaceae bacterium]